jgi:hypothetical protein
MRKWCNDFESLTRLTCLLFGRQESHRAHVVQTIRNLDHEHARVPRHRDDHLADGFALGGGAQNDLVEFGDSVDKVSDLVTEILGQLFE